MGLRYQSLDPGTGLDPWTFDPGRDEVVDEWFSLWGCGKVGSGYEDVGTGHYQDQVSPSVVIAPLQ